MGIPPPWWSIRTGTAHPCIGATHTTVPIPTVIVPHIGTIIITVTALITGPAITGRHTMAAIIDGVREIL